MQNHKEFEENLAPNRYHDKHFDRDAVKILPGEYFVTARDMLIVTVLGSCVSVCLRDYANGIGGMNHIMLPGSTTDSTPISSSARYGTYAMEILINHLLKLGADRRRFEAKIFGGGRVIKEFTFSNIGDRNVEFTLNYLNLEKIPIIAQDVLDIYPRKVYYFPSTGKVLIKKLRDVHNPTIFERELEYSTRLKKTAITGDVDLF